MHKSQSCMERSILLMTYYLILGSFRIWVRKHHELLLNQNTHFPAELEDQMNLLNQGESASHEDDKKISVQCNGRQKGAITVLPKP